MFKHVFYCVNWDAFMLKTLETNSGHLPTDFAPSDKLVVGKNPVPDDARHASSLALHLTESDVT